MRIVAVVVTVAALWRWLGFGVGIGRIRRFRGSERREARRTVAGRGAINVFASVIVVYLWALALEVQLTEVFVGFLAAATMCSLAVAVAAAFMQPERRTPETLGICRLSWPGGLRRSAPG